MEDGVQELEDGVQCREIIVFRLAVAVAPVESLPIWPPAHPVQHQANKISSHSNRQQNWTDWVRRKRRRHGLGRTECWVVSGANRKCELRLHIILHIIHYTCMKMRSVCRVHSGKLRVNG